MTISTAFFTVCGGGEDYDFLLGAIEHHAEMGRHLVLDTTPPEMAVQFGKLPESVTWIHEPVYGHGWKEFRHRTAVERAMNLVKAFGCDVSVYLDCDEFFSRDSVDRLFPYATDSMVEVNCAHWKRDGFPYMFGESEWHRRLWPSSGGVAIVENIAWRAHPNYNGNPENHCVPDPPPGLPMLRVPGNFHHHLHYALGKEKPVPDCVDGWSGGGARVPLVPWPKRLTLWKEEGVRPSESFL